MTPLLHADPRVNLIYREARAKCIPLAESIADRVIVHPGTADEIAQRRYRADWSRVFLGEVERLWRERAP